jgi:hypothetical protein
MIQTASQQQVDDLLRGPQYAMPQAEKEAMLVAILRSLCREVAEHCPPYARFLEHFAGDTGAWQTTADVPPLPVGMFKRMLLSAVPAEKVVRELHSSTTTGQHPSRIVIDKTTAFRQAHALVSVLKEHIGARRRPFLVLDIPDVASAGESLTARGAAIRGLANFASETTFAMRKLPSGDMEPAWDVVQDFFRAHGNGPMLVFGFTFIVWSRFVAEGERQGLKFRSPEAFVLHSGGWKRLAAEAVSKEEFSLRTAALLGCRGERVLDFYGMVEQVGTVLVDCSAGHKHAPAFADVVLRRPYTLAPVEPGDTGIIEVLSALPTSYPGQALLSEDEGMLLGVDDCPCGRKGRYFRFTRRIQQAEIRGCGDVFAQATESKS